MKKRLVSLFLTLTLSLSLTVPAFAAGPSFTDVAADSWAYSNVERAAADGIVNGVGGGIFKPDGNVTGAQFLTMMTKAFYADDLDAWQGPEKPWYTKNLTVAQEHGLLGNVVLDPNAPISRTQMAVVLYNILSNQEAELPGGAELVAAYNSIPDWTDVPIYAQTAVASVYSLKLITGIEGGLFAGDHTMTRAQAATVYCRLADFLSGETPSEPEQPEQPAEPEQPAGALLANGKEITDDNIREIIYALKGDYPEGLRWTNDDSYYSPAVRMTGHGCEGFALICSDAAFGDLPQTATHSDFSKIRVGDILRINNDTHAVVVLEVRENSVVVTEGNFNSSIHWGREISRQSLENGNFLARTRYPD